MTNHPTSSAALVAPPEPFGALIFDCDGTLADTMPHHYAAWLAALLPMGAEMSESYFYSLAGVPTRDIVKRLNRDFGYALDIDLVYHEKETEYVRLLDQIKEIAAVADIVRRYHGRVPMAVASGGRATVVPRTLTAVGLLGYFDTIVTADDVEHGKPSPDMFLLAARRLGVAPQMCIVYEDGDPGVEAARAAGMRCVDVRVLWEDAPEQA